MKTRIVVYLCVAIATLMISVTQGVADTTKEIKAVRQVDSVAMFKNGLVVVKETIPISGPGTYVIEDVPKAILGTFFVESDYPVETVVGTRTIESVPAETNGIEYWKQLQGKNVQIAISDKMSVQGQLLYLGSDLTKTDDVNSLLDSAGALPRNYYPPVVGVGVPRQFVIVRTTNTESAYTVFIDLSQITSIETMDDVSPKKTIPIMTFEVGEKGEVTANGEIFLFYLTKGMTWSPSYRIDISDAKTLKIEQNAIIANELMPLENADISLISGFPRVEFEQTLSLMTPDTTLLSFFNQLANVGRPSGSSHIMTQQAIMTNSFGPSMPEVNSQQISANEGPDTYYHSIGSRTLDKGSRRTILVARATAEYERMMECKIPAFADSASQTRNNNPTDSPYKKGEISDVWEVLRFKNPFDFPMTTAPATVTGNGHFLGQNSAYWTSQGAELIVPVTRAMSVQVISDEEERGGSIEPWEIIGPSGTAVQNTEKRPKLYRFSQHGSTYRKQEIDGKITVKNLRSETMKIVITRQISGEFMKSGIPAKTKILVERDSRNVNRSQELKWELALKPGEVKEIDFSYERFVSY